MFAGFDVNKFHSIGVSELAVSVTFIPDIGDVDGPIIPADHAEVLFFALLPDATGVIANNRRTRIIFPFARASEKRSVLLRDLQFGLTR